MWESNQHALSLETAKLWWTFVIESQFGILEAHRHTTERFMPIRFCLLATRSISLATLILLFGSCFVLSSGTVRAEEPNEKLPNILWLSTEDIGPQVGCYGDPDATTPLLDAFAANSLCYDVAWSNYPVCAPARTTIIGGMYAACNAAGYMRSESVMPNGVEMFPHFLREQGYYCTNTSKEDYNYKRPANEPWDESSRKAHYRNREKGQPFFAVFNYTGTHESKIRQRPHVPVIDPASVTLPQYYPDIPEIRQDMAQYLDNITVMDGWVQKQLDALKKSGEADNTIVIFFGDHGSGMPRHKRFAGDSGMRVPFVVHVPEKLKHLSPAEYAPGARTKRPIGFIDLAPTMLSIAGLEAPKYMQGHAFMGAHPAEAPQYAYGFRERMDERPDLSRSLRDEKFIYVRNYMPNLPAGQFVNYQQVTNSTRRWFEMFNAGELNDVQSQFWMPHPPEELYDLVNDPEETKNLIDDPKFKTVLARFQKEHLESMKRFGDLGMIPESIALEFGEGKRSRRLMLEDPFQFPLDEIYAIADVATKPSLEATEDLLKATKHSSASIRYWGTMGLMLRGKTAFDANTELIVGLMNDPCTA
ncbi:MAG: arylsulfatase A-like enzyme, partial [Mariniblastus sp.]